MNKKVANKGHHRERVRQVLKDLRHRSTAAGVDDDIRTLERVLGDPIFRQLSQKAEVAGPSVQKLRHPKTLLSTTNRGDERIETVRKALLPKLQPLVGQNQKLLFVDVNVRDVRPIVIETNEENRRLLIVAPTDIKSSEAIAVNVELRASPTSPPV
ncbi:hypothetical protein Tcan_01990 [Toxocara canis]|uniref:Uncharacterized protein n=1 Tax=Toxocara canis TaxID=6265 RepID=A0A0B2UUT8_TOXCA|nr:hypothetical protein Tcan_01990 [Toxocara canis]